MYIKEFVKTVGKTDKLTEYAFVSDDVPEMELSPRYRSEEECRVWYGQVAHELFDEFDVKPTEMKIN
jgi:hypothetical protein